MNLIETTAPIELEELKLFFNDKGMVKITIALARGKKLRDKRQTEKDRDWNKNKARLLKG